MPKARVEREVSNDGTLKTIEIETAKGGEEKDAEGKGLTVTAQYTVPANAEKFREMIFNLSDKPDNGAFLKLLFGPDRQDQNEAPLETAYRYFVSAIDKAVRASVYESIQAESTEISVGSGKPKFDLMTVPPAKLVVGINGMRGKRISDLMVLGITDANAPEHAESVKSVDRKLNYNQFQTAARKLVESGKARENAASGMLEVVTA